MNPANQDEDALYDAARHFSDPAARAAFLDQACAGNAALREHLEALLRAAPEADDFFGRRAVDLNRLPPLSAEMPTLVPPSEQPGEMIGPYKLREQIGEGGFGTVWVADQEHPVRRRVALKIIKMGMDTKEVIARFEQERQALAMMDHPNIAKVLDAGATQLGRPFFVMELVRGMKITDYCDNQQLSTAERIGLFISVCQAVQHAHQKGIIHRDLKPSNILVTVNEGAAVPKVIDFGVAKATQGRLSEHSIYTQFQQMVGTPLYMSPEQAELTSLDIDTRSDIYSLGVLLYELLTGHTPIEQDTLARVGLDEIRRIIREVEPPRPSMRIKTLDGAEMTTAAKRRHIEPSKLPATLKGDLDWIVMKCLEKDRKRRYDTANGLALDLRRHLQNEVVIARPPTTAYLLSKLMRRNKLVFAAGAAIVTSLFIGIVASLWQANRADRAAGRAELEAQRAVTALDELRATAPAFAEQARALAEKEKFDEAVQKLDYAIKLQPDEPEYLVAKGDLLQCQRKLAEAAEIYREALRVRPGLPHVEASAALCDELLAAPLSAQGTLTRESLAKLHLAMQQQQRPAAELMPVARLLGKEKELLIQSWLTRLKDLPVSADMPLKDRLTVRDDGRLALDLSGTKVFDLSTLAGAPLAVLNVSGTKVQSELSDLSPLRGLNLISLNISATSVTDLTPLSGMHSLEILVIQGSKVTDLSPLSALRLKVLNFRGCPVSDLTPIRTMPLEELDLGGTRVSNLSPLIGMPVKHIDLSYTPVLDFSPLAQLPLEKCYLQGNRITDLAVLRGKPLKELVLWGCPEVRNFAVIPEIKTLELLLLPSTYRDLPAADYAAIGALRAHPNLRQLGSEIMNGMNFAATGSKDLFWQDWDREQSFVPALRAHGLKFSLLKLPSGTYHLRVIGQPLQDLSVLGGAPISVLSIQICPVSNLAPIHNLKLNTLYLASDLVADLSPLQGMPLNTLYLSGDGITDLTPLKDLPLQEVYLSNCKNVTDVAVLAGIPSLEKVTVPFQARNIEDLRKLTKLQRLAFNSTVTTLLPATTVEEFWKDLSPDSWLTRLRALGSRPGTLTRLDDGTWEVDLDRAPITDFGIFKGAPISSLGVSHAPVTDLTPLRGMPLKSLRFYRTGITDLRPLEGMPLTRLNLGGTTVTDLTPVRGMPLTELYLHNCDSLTDLSPLAETKGLTKLTLPPGATNFEFLRAFPKLERLSYRQDRKTVNYPDQSAAGFWRAFDDRKALSHAESCLAEGRVDEALSTLAEVAGKRPDDIFFATKLAALQVWFGKDAEHESICDRLLKWAGDSKSPVDAERVAKIVSLRPVTDPSRREASLVLARRSVELGKQHVYLPYFKMALGMAAYRAGHYPEADEALASAPESAGALGEPYLSRIQAITGFYRAMSLVRQGKRDEAQELFTAAEEEMKPFPANEKDPLAGNDARDSQDDLIVWLACKEAKTLLAGPGTAGKQD